MYKINVYNNTGTYLTTLDNVADMGEFTRSLNEGDGTLNLPVPLPFNSSNAALTIGNEVRISKEINGNETVLYSGFVKGVSRIMGDNESITINLVSYTGRLARTMLVASGHFMSFTRDGTNSADVGSLDSKKSSDQIKFIINNFRARNASEDQTNSSGTNDIGFGSTARITQAFTTGTDTEKLALVGVAFQIKYNTNTKAQIDVSIRADDGTGKPTGANLAVTRVTQLDNTDYKWMYFYFDTPLTLTASTKYHIYLTSSSAGATNTYMVKGDTGGADYYASGDYASSADGGSTWTVHTADDLQFKTLYVDESKVRINYTSTSIDSSGDSKVFVYTGMNDLQALNYVSKYAPADWNWYMDANWTVHFHPAGFSRGLILDNCNATTGWTNGADIGTISTNTSEKREGSASLTFPLGGTATTHFIYKDLSATDISAYNNVGCWVYIPSSTQLARLGVRLYSNSQARYSEWYIPTSAINLGDWNWLTPLVNFNTTPDVVSGGTLTKTGVDRIALVIYTIATAETTTWIMDDWKVGNIALTTLTRGKDILELAYETNIDDLTNRYFVANNATSSAILRGFQNSTSIATYGVFEDVRIDGRLTDSTTINDIGNDYIARYSNPVNKLEFTIVNNFDIGSLMPNYTIRLLGFDASLNLNKYFIITGINFRIDTATIQVSEIGTAYSERISALEQKVELLETYNSSTGDFPANEIPSV